MLGHQKYRFTVPRYWLSWQSSRSLLQRSAVQIQSKFYNEFYNTVDCLKTQIKLKETLNCPSIKYRFKVDFSSSKCTYYISVYMGRMSHCKPAPSFLSLVFVISWLFSFFRSKNCRPKALNIRFPFLMNSPFSCFCRCFVSRQNYLGDVPCNCRYSLQGSPGQLVIGGNSSGQNVLSSDLGDKYEMG